MGLFLQKYRASIIVFTLSLSANLLYFAFFGFGYAADETAYRNAALRLFAGDVEFGMLRLYLVYVAVLGIFFEAGMDRLGVVVFQVLVFSAAAIPVFHLARKLAGNPAAIIAATLFVGNLSVLKYNFYLTTDSLYISYIVFYVWLLQGIDRRSIAGVTSVLFFITCMGLFRPSSWILVLIAYVYFALIKISQPRAQIAFLTGLSAAFVIAALNLKEINAGQQGQLMYTALINGEITASYADWRLTMPASDASHEPSIRSFLSYVFTFPFASAKLIGYRMLVDILHWRPYYSFLHNLIDGIYLGLMYLCASVFAFRNLKNRLVLLTAGVVIATLVFIGLTWVDWDCRYSTHVIPLVGILASGAVKFTRLPNFLRIRR